MCDKFLQYSKKKNLMIENPLFSLHQSEMLKIDKNEHDSYMNGKKLIMDRLNVYNKSPQFDYHESLKLVTHMPSPKILRVKSKQSPSALFLTGFETMTSPT
jgi:hypothetical protein